MTRRTMKLRRAIWDKLTEEGYTGGRQKISTFREIDALFSEGYLPRDIVDILEYKMKRCRSCQRYSELKDRLCEVCYEMLALQERIS